MTAPNPNGHQTFFPRPPKARPPSPPPAPPLTTALRAHLKNHDVIDVLALCMKIIIEKNNIFGPLMSVINSTYENVVRSHADGVDHTGSMFGDLMLTNVAHRDLRQLRTQRAEDQRTINQLSGELRAWENKVTEQAKESHSIFDLNRKQEQALKEMRTQWDVERHAASINIKALQATRRQLENVSDDFEALKNGMDAELERRIAVLQYKYEDILIRQRDSRRTWLFLQKEMITCRLRVTGQETYVKQLETTMKETAGKLSSSEEEVAALKIANQALDAETQQLRKEAQSLKVRFGLVNYEDELKASNHDMWSNFLDDKAQERVVTTRPKSGKEHMIYCRGVAKDIPEHLRYCGKVRNLALEKGVVETLIQTIWDNKLRLETAELRSYHISEVLYIYLSEKYENDQGLICEYGYSLEDALERFKYDADCELFRRILNNTLHQEAFADQMKHIATLHTAIADAAAMDNGNLAARGMINVAALHKCLEEFYFKREPEEVDRLKLCIAKDQLGLTLNYDALFQSNANGDQGFFIEDVRDQYLDDLITYQSQVRDLLHECGDIDTDKVNIAVFRQRWIAMCDDSAHVDAHLALASSHSLSRLASSLHKNFLKRPNLGLDNIFSSSQTGMLRRLQSKSVIKARNLQRQSIKPKPQRRSSHWKSEEPRKSIFIQN